METKQTKQTKPFDDRRSLGLSLAILIFVLAVLAIVVFVLLAR